MSRRPSKLWRDEHEDVEARIRKLLKRTPEEKAHDLQMLRERTDRFLAATEGKGSILEEAIRDRSRANTEAERRVAGLALEKQLEKQRYAESSVPANPRPAPKADWHGPDYWKQLGDVGREKLDREQPGWREEAAKGWPVNIWAERRRTWPVEGDAERARQARADYAAVLKKHAEE